MSHAATNWAIQPRGLKPATKIVLWHLADRHNGDTGQCNPKQERLAQDCEMSRSTLNLHLNELERLGLIRRIVTIDGATKRQRPTAYVLVGFEREAASENRTRKPCPKNAESRVRNSDTKNPVREPGRCAGEQARRREGQRQGQGYTPEAQREGLRSTAEKIRQGAYVAPSAIRPDQARQMLQEGWVAKEELRRAGIHY